MHVDSIVRASGRILDGYSFYSHGENQQNYLQFLACVEFTAATGAKDWGLLPILETNLAIEERDLAILIRGWSTATIHTPVFRGIRRSAAEKSS